MLPARSGSGPGNDGKGQRGVLELFRQEPTRLRLSGAAVVDASGSDVKPFDDRRCRAPAGAELLTRRQDRERPQLHAPLSHGLIFEVRIGRAAVLRDRDQNSGPEGAQGKRLGRGQDR